MDPLLWSACWRIFFPFFSIEFLLCLLIFRSSFYFYWSTVSLQCYVSFCCTTMWIAVSIHISPPSWGSLHPSSLSSEEHFNTYLFIWLGQVLVLARRSSLVSRFLSTCLEGSEVVVRGLSSPTRDWTHIHCTGRQILNRWTTREVPKGRAF